MAEDNSKQEGQEVSVWPGRYYVEATLGQLTHRGHIYKDVLLQLFRSDMSKEEKMTLLEPLGFTQEVKADPYFTSQVEETFSEDQADQLINWLVKQDPDKVKAWKRPAEKPKEGYMGISAIPMGGLEDAYILDEMDGYDLDFKAEAFFNLNLAEYQEPAPGDKLTEYLEKTALGRLKEQIDFNIQYISQAEVQELKEYLDQKIKSREEDHDRE